jgi:hypothetical protein
VAVRKIDIQLVIDDQGDWQKYFQECWIDEEGVSQNKLVEFILRLQPDRNQPGFVRDAEDIIS